jgi:hypothetical protein
MSNIVTVKKLANMVMTMYYKGFRPTNGPFRLEHFIFLCVAADAKLKQDEYNNERLLKIRMRMIHSEINMSPDNYDTITIPVKKESAKLPNRIMAFSGDRHSLGVNFVKPEGKCKGQFIRINPDEKWTVESVKDVVFWYPEGQCIKFINMNHVCTPDNVTVNYIPEITEKSAVQKSREQPIMTMVMNFIKAFDANSIVDMSNDGNPNVATQTEINRYLLKAVQKG